MKKLVHWVQDFRKNGRELEIRYSPLTVFMVAAVLVGVLLQAGMAWAVAALACIVGLLVCIVYVTGGYIADREEDE
jgi:hypothetical protein